MGMSRVIRRGRVGFGKRKFIMFIMWGSKLFRVIWIRRLILHINFLSLILEDQPECFRI
jgi:hypothetical protein